MMLRQILLHIFYQLNNERTINAAYHLLRGKRSGQTIQDVGIFKLYPYFGILRKLARPVFEDGVNSLGVEGWIRTDDNGYFTLTESGLEQVRKLALPFFDGWHYQGNEHIFYGRLSLIVQSLSNQAAGIRSFIPVQRNEEIQGWCRQFLLASDFRSGMLQQALYHEMKTSMEQSGLSTLQKELLVERLTGVGVTGIPWQQLSFEHEMTELDCQLLFISALHKWLDTIHQHNEQFPYLLKLAENIRIDNVLTGSAYQTAQMYNQGYSLEQISAMRRLKASTIEDHLVELAMNEPTFDSTPFISHEQHEAVQQAVRTYATRKLRVLHDALPHLSYFQIRLALAKGEV